ncbi:MAG: flagellar motor switch protein FliM [Treponema sp.]|nr:flagellar motor switch protein FliM [Treponema sp.]MCL2250769.1 flagellar motor switch protein FliM [Treponema sp.]
MTDVLSADEIDQLLTAINNSDNSKPADFRPAAGSRKIKIYDFKRPDRFSKEQLRNISIIHEHFARLITNSITAKCRAMSYAHIASVDQLTFEEFIRSVPTPSSLGIINMHPLNGYAVLEIDPSISFAMLDRILGGYGNAPNIQHEMTDIEKSLMTGIFNRMIANLCEAWMPVLNLQPRLEAIETNPQFLKISQPTEMIVLVTIEFRILDTEGMMNFCIPFPTVESIIGKLSNVFGYAEKRNNNQKIDLENLDGLKKSIRAEYFRKEITVNQLVDLLDTKGTIIINDQAPFTGRLFIDNLCIGEFCNAAAHCCQTENNSYKKINIIKKEWKLEKNYMSEKNNVLETTGALKDINVQIIAELGRRSATLEQVSNFEEGTILELDKLAGEPVDIYANNVKIAIGEVVVVDENFGVRIIDIIKTEK